MPGLAAPGIAPNHFQQHMHQKGMNSPSPGVNFPGQPGTPNVQSQNPNAGLGAGLSPNPGQVGQPMPNLAPNLSSNLPNAVQATPPVMNPGKNLPHQIASASSLKPIDPNEPVKPTAPIEPECSENQITSMRQALADMINKGLMDDPRYDTLAQQCKRSEHLIKQWSTYKKNMATYEVLKKNYDAKKLKEADKSSQDSQSSQDSNLNSSQITNDPSMSTISINDISTESFVNEKESIEMNQAQLDQLRAQILVFKSLTKMEPVNEDEFKLATSGKNVKKLDLSKVDTKLTMPDSSFQVKTHAIPPEQLDANSMKTSTGLKEFGSGLVEKEQQSADIDQTPDLITRESTKKTTETVSAQTTANPTDKLAQVEPTAATIEDQPAPVPTVPVAAAEQPLIPVVPPPPQPKKKEFDAEYLKQTMVEYSCRTKLTPLSKPAGPDLLTIFKERDHRVQARIENRIMLLSNLPVLENHQLYLKAQTELRALRLIGLQRKIRQEVIQAHQQQTSLDTIVNMKHYRRTKKISLREARVTEKLEKQREMVLEQRKKQRFFDYIEAVMDHAQKFTNYHKNVQSKIQKNSVAIITYHKNYERDRKREEERLERERLKLLQQDDEDGYRKLIDAKKNKRLAYLLDQTDDYLMQMMSLVRDHQSQLQGKKAKFHYSTAINIDPNAQVPVKHVKTNSYKITEEDGAPARRNLVAWLQMHPGWQELTPIEITNYKKKQDERLAEIEKKKQAEKYAGKTDEEIAALKIQEGMEKEDKDNYETKGDENKDYYSVGGLGF